MSNNIKLIFKDLKEEEIKEIIYKIFKLNTPIKKIIIEIKKESIYIFKKDKTNKLIIYNFTNINNFQIINKNNIIINIINTKESYKLYKKNKYNNIILFASILYTNNIFEIKEIVNKLNVKNKKRIIKNLTILYK